MTTNKMALDALTAALDAMEHMANTLNNMDAVDEDEDAQHDAAFEAVRLAIAQLEQPQKSRIVAASMNSYPEADQRFFNFWYGHMFEDLMQPPLVGIDHATARYIWNAAAIAALQAEPQGWRPIETAPRDGTDILLAIIDAEHAYIDHVERGYFEVVAEDEEDGPWDIRGGEPWCSYEGRSEGLYWCYAAGPDDFNRRGIRFLDSSDCLKYTHWMPLPTPPKD